MRALVADVGDFHRDRRGHLPLNSRIPRVHGRQALNRRPDSGTGRTVRAQQWQRAGRRYLPKHGCEIERGWSLRESEYRVSIVQRHRVYVAKCDRLIGQDRQVLRYDVAEV
jgi:hypothetical protein